MPDDSYLKVEKVIYNDYEFPWGTTYRLFGSPIYDDANRSIRCWEWTLTCDFLGEYDDLPWDETLSGFREETMYNIRHALTQSARPLRIEGLSFGAVEIGSFATTGDRATGVRYIPDVQFGPRPSLYTLELKSGPYMSTVIWECKFYTHSCIIGDAPATLPMFLSFTMENDFDVRDGLTRRMTVIEAHIPNRHHSEASYWKELISADEYVWVTNRLPIPEGFRRRVSRKVAKDGLSIVFRILDEEIPSNEAFAPYLTDVRAPFHVASRLIGSGNNGLEPQGFSLWLCQLGFDCSVKKYEDKRHAIKAFFDLVKVKYAATKVRALSMMTYVDKDGQQKTAVKPGRPTLLELEFENDSYSLDFSGRAVWIVETTPKDYVNDTNLFEEPGKKWSDWLNSMASAHRAIGIAGLTVGPTDRPIIDACNSEPIGTLGPTVGVKPIVKLSLPTETPCPPYRIIAFRPKYSVEEETNQVVHSPNVAPASEEKKDGGEQTQTAQETTTISPPIVQSVGQSEYRLIFTGHVTTTTASPSLPSVVKYQGANATRVGKPVVRRVPINGVGHCVIWRTEWAIEYSLDKAPKEEGESKIEGPRFETDPEESTTEI